MGRKLSFGLGMEACIVAHVNEIGLLGTYGTGKVNGRLDGLVRPMRRMAQTIYHQRMYPTQCLKRLFGDSKHIGNKAQSPYPITKNGELAMHHL